MLSNSQLHITTHPTSHVVSPPEQGSDSQPNIIHVDSVTLMTLLGLALGSSIGTATYVVSKHERQKISRHKSESEGRYIS